MTKRLTLLPQLNLRWVFGRGLGYKAIRNERTIGPARSLSLNRDYFKEVSR